MFSWLRRHKGKFLVLGASVASSYVAARWLLRRATELQETRHKSEAEESRLQRHYENNRITSLRTVVSLLPRLQEAVQAQLNAEAITEELKTQSSGKITLWENLKIICFARVVVSVYVVCAVSTVLRVQLSILGGDLSLRHRDQGSGDAARNQQQNLTTVQYLMGEGLEQLVRRVRDATERVLVSYSLKHQLTAEGVVQLLRDIHSLSSSSSSHRRPSAGSEDSEETSFLVQYLLPKEQLLERAEEMAQLSVASRDILESGEFAVVLEGCVELGFSLLYRQLTEIYHSAVQSEASLPVARVVPMMADMFDVLFSVQHNTLVQEVGSSPELHKLSKNIFETFSRSS